MPVYPGARTDHRLSWSVGSLGTPEARIASCGWAFLCELSPLAKFSRRQLQFLDIPTHLEVLRGEAQSTVSNRNEEADFQHERE